MVHYKSLIIDKKVIQIHRKQGDDTPTEFLEDMDYLTEEMEKRGNMLVHQINLDVGYIRLFATQKNGLVGKLIVIDVTKADKEYMKALIIEHGKNEKHF